MKALVINREPSYWLSPFIELDNLFEPLVSSVEPVKEKITETPFAYNLIISIPEFRKKDLDIRLENNEIILKGQRKYSSGILKRNKREYSTSFERRFAVSEDMDVDNIKAKFKNSELQLEIPKRDEFVNYREIPVEGALIPVEKNKQELKVNRGFMRNVKQKFQKTFNRAA